jgi:hypothetical protein
MLELLRGKTSDRKLRLFAVACCHRIAHLMKHTRSLEAVDAAEQYADGLITRGELAAAHSAVRSWWETEAAAAWAAGPVAEAGAAQAAQAAALAAGQAGPGAMNEEAAAEAAAQAGLLREIIGNPWRPLTWALGTDPQAHAEVLAIARRAYDERDFAALPILADALEEAGCADQLLLDHLRGPGPHVRGCVALDAILGRT